MPELSIAARALASYKGRSIGNVARMGLLDLHTELPDIVIARAQGVRLDAAQDVHDPTILQPHLVVEETSQLF